MTSQPPPPSGGTPYEEPTPYEGPPYDGPASPGLDDPSPGTPSSRALARIDPVGDPPPPGAAYQSPYQPYQQPGSYPPPGPSPVGYPPYAFPPPYPYPRRTNTMAVLALVFGFVFSPAAIVLGHIARRQIRETGEDGDGLALAGLILGYVFTGLLVAFCLGYVAFFIAFIGAFSSAAVA